MILERRTKTITTIRLDAGRFNRLYDELVFALSRVNTAELKQCGKKSMIMLGMLGIRRGIGFLRFIFVLSRLTIFEGIAIMKAVKRDRLEELLETKGGQLSSRVKSLLSRTKKHWNDLSKRLRTKPRETIPLLFLTLIGFLFGSGGLDGNGGIPDTDIKVGIGHHRSIWTHSIIPAMVFETIVFLLLILVDTIYMKLPTNHDQLWDQLVENNKNWAVAVTGGLGAGLAYPLFSDINFTSSQGKAYADLPFSTTSEGHKGILGTNAIIEILDLNKKQKNFLKTS